MSVFEYEATADNIMAWLDEGGYSCVLYVGKRRAYVTDEDDDYGWQRIPMTVVRQLFRDGRLAVWDTYSAANIYTRYRPTAWVKQWNMGQRPWFSDAENQRILQAHVVGALPPTDERGR